MLERAVVDSFQDVVWEHYSRNGRSMPWRDNPDPYWIIVSEVMLQQTQVRRVEPKFNEFIHAFPNPHSLADASLAEIFQYWSGLGYNRRAKFLWQAANLIVKDHKGSVPSTVEELDALPGIGYNTAAAIVNYAFCQPIPFVETNIRTVLLHHFYPEVQSVTDATLLNVAEQVLDREDPRQWHWALMDYGVHLKATSGGRLNQSAHYKKQLPLAGSNREMRGRVMKALLSGAMAEEYLKEVVQADQRFDQALNALVDEQLIHRKDNILSLTGDVPPSIIGVNR